MNDPLGRVQTWFALGRTLRNSSTVRYMQTQRPCSFWANKVWTRPYSLNQLTPQFDLALDDDFVVNGLQRIAVQILPVTQESVRRVGKLALTYTSKISHWENGIIRFLECSKMPTAENWDWNFSARFLIDFRSTSFPDRKLSRSVDFVRPKILYFFSFVIE